MSSKVKLLHLGKIVGDLQMAEEDLARLPAKIKKKNEKWKGTENASEEFLAVRLGHRMLVLDSRNVVYGARECVLM